MAVDLFQFLTRDQWLAEQADRERLRGLIKIVEKGSPYIENCCPFCSRYPRMEPHAIDCPAFTPDGEVK